MSMIMIHFHLMITNQLIEGNIMKGYIKRLLREELLDEDITSGGSQIIYHRTNKSSFKKICSVVNPKQRIL